MAQTKVWNYYITRDLFKNFVHVNDLKLMNNSLKIKVEEKRRFFITLLLKFCKYLLQLN